MALLATVIYYWAFASGTSLLLSGSPVCSAGNSAVLVYCRGDFSAAGKITVMRLCGLMLGFAGVILIAKPWQVSGESISLAGWVI